jgi:hypothetical protein
LALRELAANGGTVDLPLDMNSSSLNRRLPVYVVEPNTYVCFLSSLAPAYRDGKVTITAVFDELVRCIVQRAWHVLGMSQEPKTLEEALNAISERDYLVAEFLKRMTDGSQVPLAVIASMARSFTYLSDMSLTQHVAL